MVKVESQVTSESLGSGFVLTDKQLGRGAMGRVFLGYVRETGVPLAVKVLRPELAEDPEIVARFLQERTVLMGLDHPNLVKVHDLVIESGRAAVVMDLIDGIDLRRLLASEGQLSRDQALVIAREIFSALAAVHRLGIVHRDVKPENVLVSRMGRASLTDFGIAKLTASRTITRMTGLIGTPEYIAPEAIEDSSNSPSIDIYSAGIVIYEMLSGSTPFSGGHPLSVLKRHVEDAPVRPPLVDDTVWSWLSSLIAKSPQDRPSANEAFETCSNILGERIDEVTRQIAALVEEALARPDVSALDVLSTINSSRRTSEESARRNTAQETVLSSRRSAERQSENLEAATRSKSRRRRYLALTVAFVVLLAGGIGTILIMSGSPAHAPIASAPYEFSALPVSGPPGVSVAQSVTLSGAGDRTVTESAQLKSSSSKLLDLNVILQTPSAMMTSTQLNAISISPSTGTVIGDPRGTWAISLAPHLSATVSATFVVKSYVMTPAVEAVKIMKDAEAEVAKGLPTSAVIPGSSVGQHAFVAVKLVRTIKVKKDQIDALLASPSQFTEVVGHTTEVVAKGMLPSGKSAPASQLGGTAWRVLSGSSVVAVTSAGSVARVLGLSPGFAVVEAKLHGLVTRVMVTIFNPSGLSSGSTVGRRSGAGGHKSGTGKTPTTITVTGPTSPPLSAPGEPTGVQVAVSSTSASVSWTAPTFDGGTPVISYVVTTSPSSAGCMVAAPATRCTIDGLASGVAYTFSVTAVNAQGQSLGATAGGVTPTTLPPAQVPGPPTGISFTGVGQTYMTVRWSPPVSDGGAAILSYSVGVSVTGAGCSTSGTSCSVSGLSAGTGYTVCVSATNSVGTGSPSCGSVSTQSAPAPTTTTTTAAPPPPPPPAPTPTVTLGKGNAYGGGEYWTTMSVSNFPTGASSYYCHFSDGTSYGPYYFTVSAPSQTWSPSGTGAGVGCYAGGFSVYVTVKASNGVTYTSNSVAL